MVRDHAFHLTDAVINMYVLIFRIGYGKVDYSVRMEFIIETEYSLHWFINIISIFYFECRII
jgi:hypothetical protein